jgi:hypothetical protein
MQSWKFEESSSSPIQWAIIPCNARRIPIYSTYFLTFVAKSIHVVDIKVIFSSPESGQIPSNVNWNNPNGHQDIPQTCSQKMRVREIDEMRKKDDTHTYTQMQRWEKGEWMSEGDWVTKHENDSHKAMRIVA